MSFKRRQDGSEDFHRGWDDCETGNLQLISEIWLGVLGLHKIYCLTDSDTQYQLRVALKDFSHVHASANIVVSKYLIFKNGNFQFQCYILSICDEII